LRHLVDFVKLVAQLLLKLGRMLAALDVSLDDFENAHPLANEETAVAFRQVTKFAQLTNAPVRLQITR